LGAELVERLASRGEHNVSLLESDYECCVLRVIDASRRLDIRTTNLNGFSISFEIEEPAILLVLLAIHLTFFYAKNRPATSFEILF